MFPLFRKAKRTHTLLSLVPKERGAGVIFRVQFQPVCKGLKVGSPSLPVSRPPTDACKLKRYNALMSDQLYCFVTTDHYI